MKKRTFCFDGYKDGVLGVWQFWYDGYDSFRDFKAARNASNSAYTPAEVRKAA